MNIKCIQKGMQQYKKKNPLPNSISNPRVSIVTARV